MAKVSISLSKIRFNQAQENLIDAKYLYEKVVIKGLIIEPIIQSFTQ